MDGEIVCLECGCRVIPYGPYCNHKMDYADCGDYFCPLCDTQIKC